MLSIRRSSISLLQFLHSSSKSSTIFCSAHLQIPFFLFTSKAELPSTETPFIVEYLINSVGLSPEKAIKASKFSAHIKSPAQPDSVRHFFKQHGFTEADIKRIILGHSRILCARVDSTLKPKFEGLSNLGFSEIQIVKLVTGSPLTLNYMNFYNVFPRIEFLRSFLGSNDRIMKAFSHDVSLLARSFEKVIKPNIIFLTECKVSDAIIGCMLTEVRSIIGRPLSFLKAAVKRIDELGIPRGSWMFYQALRSLCSNTSEQVDAKIKLLGGLGFSETEVSSAIRKQPYILSLSEKNLHETGKFLVKEAGCDHSYLSSHPNIFTFSLSKRLVPRNQVLKLLKTKGILKKKLGFYNVSSMSERKFVEKFIFRYKEKMPELHDVYLSASAGEIPNWCVML
ncbi:uncharacterized protein LOC110021537 isoform X2 [Phalaenopsis equestris]|uniref:uncharacterized protein LOC110021537 isoform X2 n=1 Tax=Phalaenopsis equestris TaxID=78828 RepID=UPI0009E50F4F|nr:uncharacterized protein LOC110021537 isoform X2 [Phalaenopsis equestris]